MMPFILLPQWANDVREKVTLANGESIPLLLLANKVYLVILCSFILFVHNIYKHIDEILTC